MSITRFAAPGSSRLSRALLALTLPLTALLAPVVTHAQAGQPAAVSDQLPLWEVSRDGSSIYLLGSVHMLRPEAYPLDEAFYDAFDSAAVMAFEVDLATAAASAPMMMARGMYSDGQTLRTVLPPELYADLQQRVAPLGIPLQALDMMKPWLVSLTLNALALQQAGFEAQLGVDMHFFERGTSQGKRIVAMETIEDQLDVFDGLDPAQQAALLRTTLNDMDKTLEQMDEISSVWASGDVERLAEMMTESMGDQPELRERLLYARNRNWIPRIEALLAAGDPAIVIVGLGHMVGEGSVTQLLTDRGYEVERVAPAAVH
jgi:uncharacterized protein YbaP (TraB family)